MRTARSPRAAWSDGASRRVLGCLWMTEPNCFLTSHEPASTSSTTRCCLSLDAPRPPLWISATRHARLRILNPFLQLYALYGHGTRASEECKFSPIVSGAWVWNHRRSLAWFPIAPHVTLPSRSQLASQLAHSLHEKQNTLTSSSSSTRFFIVLSSLQWWQLRRCCARGDEDVRTVRSNKQASNST